MNTGSSGCDRRRAAHSDTKQFRTITAGSGMVWHSLVDLKTYHYFFSENTIPVCCRAYRYTDYNIFMIITENVCKSANHTNRNFQLTMHHKPFLDWVPLAPACWKRTARTALQDSISIAGSGEGIFQNREIIQKK